MTTDIIHNKNHTVATAPTNWLTLFRRNNGKKSTQHLLRDAYRMLEKAERDLSHKDQRIKTLESLLTTDELTGLTNRRGFYRHFTQELDRTNRGINDGGILVMIDLDYFKAINDNFGHQAGDEALRVVGSFLNQQVRNMDVAARLGGDEFILLLPSTDSFKALERVKKISEDLNNLSFKWDGATINIRGSLGIREYGQNDTVESIIEDADQLMYQNKAEGRELTQQ